MKSGMELYVKPIEECGFVQISLLAFPCQCTFPEEIFDAAYKAFSEARKITGGSLCVEGIEAGRTWPPVVEIGLKDMIRKGYAAVILIPEKEISECLQELQKIGYEMA